VTAARVDLLNIGLMLASLGVACVLPFELFLFSYAVLGPLHYLTQISWLHQRQYFVPRRRDALLLVAPLAAVLAQQAGWIAFDIGRWEPVLNALAVGIALAIVFCRGTRARAAVIGAAAFTGLLLLDVRGAHDVLRVFLPTLLHVWLFTGAFVLLGALRGRSATGFASLAVFAAASAACFLLPTGGQARAVSPSYDPILPLNATLLDWFGAPARSRDEALFSPLGLAVARFIAFAYTYHYLNWFSKTSIIQWHRIPLAWTVTNLALWIVAVSLYAWDYSLGLAALFALSYLHVYLELPLNGRTFAEIGRQLGGLAGLRRAALLVGCLLFPLAACSGSAAPRDGATTPLRVAAASDLAVALPQLVELHQRRTDRNVDVIVGSSGLLSRQIAQGAPFDLFFSADAGFADGLVRDGHAQAQDRQVYALGRLVLWSTAAAGAPESLAELAEPRWERIAIANPEHAPYGRAARQALAASGVLGSVSPRLVYGENILHTLALVRSGNAQAGLVALALAAGADDGRWILLDDALHEPLEQVVVILAGTQDADAARGFLDTVASPEGREILRRLGLVLPGETLPTEAHARGASGGG